MQKRTRVRVRVAVRFGSLSRISLIVLASDRGILKYCIGPIGALAPIGVAIGSYGCIAVAIGAVSAIGSICAQSYCIMRSVGLWRL